MLIRTSTPGPELDFVKTFLDHVAQESTDLAVSVFCEPQLETGYPDAVIVHWDRRIADTWPADRAALIPDDLRLLHFIIRCRGLARDAVPKMASAIKTAQALERLQAAELVKVSTRWIRARPLREVFALRRIIAIEAKISNWRSGLRQAFANTWFASESYLLLPRVPVGSKVLQEARRCGLGIITSAGTLATPQVRSRRSRLPQSYASWLFNEWAWRGFGTQRS